MTRDEAAPGGGGAGLPFDTTKGYQARGYDYLLGGKDNYAADRAGAEAWLKVDPGLAFTARANRAFRGRAVRYLTADLRDTGTVLSKAGQLLDFAQPVAIMLVSIMHAIPDVADPQRSTFWCAAGRTR